MIKEQQTRDIIIDTIMKHKNPGAVVACSLIFPGLGQFYNEQFAEGIAFILVSSYMLSLPDVGPILFSIVYIISPIVAYKSAKKINESLTFGATNLYHISFTPIGLAVNYRF